MGGGRSLPQVSRPNSMVSNRSGMREHPLLASPLHAFPHRHPDPDVDFALRAYGEGDWPSELPTGGRAGWSRFDAEDGEVVISYPAVRSVAALVMNSPQVETASC